MCDWIFFNEILIKGNQSNDDMTSISVSLVLLGSGAVGKSSMTIRFIRDSWSDEYDPTIEDSYVKQLKLEVDGQMYLVNLEITDTAGQENYRGLWGDRYLRESDAFMLVYSITEQDTLMELKSQAQQIFNAKEDHRIPLMVVGNKSDLQSRKVSPSEGSNFTKQISDSAMFKECSAKTGSNVDSCFLELVQQVIRNKAPAKKTLPRKASKQKDKYKKTSNKCCTIL